MGKIPGMVRTHKKQGFTWVFGIYHSIHGAIPTNYTDLSLRKGVAEWGSNNNPIIINQ